MRYACLKMRSAASILQQSDLTELRTRCRCSRCLVICECICQTSHGLNDMCDMCLRAGCSSCKASLWRSRLAPLRPWLTPASCSGSLKASQQQLQTQQLRLLHQQLHLPQPLQQPGCRQQPAVQGQARHHRQAARVQLLHLLSAKLNRWVTHTVNPCSPYECAGLQHSP
jgi:hypothetical protein